MSDKNIGDATAGIDLLRHGDTGHVGFRGQLDDPLSALGWSQLRASVGSRHWDTVVSSTLQRCAAFAHELADARAVPLRLDKRLAEYHFGDWQGVPMQTLADEQSDALGRFWADPVAHPPPGAETIAQLRERACAALDEIVPAPAARRVLVITHGGVIRLLRCVAERRDLRDMAGLDVAHASLHRIRWRHTATSSPT